MDNINYAVLTETAVAPTRKYPTDAGIDVYSDLYHTMQPGEIFVFPTGVTFDIPTGYVLQAWPKGRSNFLVGAGVIDAGYQGEILIKVFDVTQDILTIHQGEAIAQLLVIPVETPEPVQLALGDIHQNATSRADTGGIISQG